MKLSHPRWLRRLLAVALVVACEPAVPDASSASAAPGPTPAASPEPLRPPALPAQTLAFTRYRWAVLSGDRVDVYRTTDFEPVARFDAPGARNVVPVLGSGLLIAADEHVHRLSAGASRAERFVGLSHPLQGALLLPHPRHSEQLALYRHGEPSLWKYDLGNEMTDVVPSTATVALDGFDQRAVTHLRDGAFAYTVPEGLAIVSRAGRRRLLELGELSPRVWALQRAARLDRLWAIDDRAAYLIALRGEPRVTSRLDLPPGGVAVASAASRLALLSVERRGGDSDSLRLRVDVWDRDPERHRVLRFSDASPGASDDEFRPEIALSPVRHLVSARVFATQVFDWRRGVRRLWLPPAEAGTALASKSD